MISAKDVQVLNTQIENIHTEKTKIETRQEMLKKQLSEELKSYKTQFGVDLEGRDIAQTKSLIEAETKKVTTEVEREYNLKVKVVDAINKGDYDTAYELLGIEVESAEVVEDEVLESESSEGKVEEPIVEASEEDNIDTLLSEALGEEEEESVIPTVEEEEIVEEPKVKEVPPVKETPKKETKKASIADVFGSMEMEDEEEDSLFGIDDNSFGFGEALKGTKFGVED